MTNRERINRTRKSIHYSDLLDEKAFTYQIFESFAKQSSQFFKKSVFSTRLNRMKKMLSIQNQIIQKEFYEFKVLNFSNFLLKHDISNSKTKNEEKDVKNSQQNEFLNLHTSTRESDFQITFSVIRIRHQSRHKRSHRRFTIEFESANQKTITVKKKTLNLYFKLIDKDVKSSISLMIKDIDEFKKNVIERSAN